MEFQVLDDYTLLKACFDGQTEAFGRIVRKYQSYICALTYSAVGDPEKSEELAQEIFVIAWRNLSQVRDCSKFKSWLYRITKNHIKRFYRDKRRDVLFRATPITEADLVVTSREDPAVQAISKERRQLVWNALSQIPAPYRDSLVLFYREGKSIRQVAHFFDLTEVAARKRLSRARAMIRASVEKDLEETISASCPGESCSTSVLALIKAGTLVSAGSASAATTAAAAGAEGTGWFSAFTGCMTAKITMAVSILVLTVTTGSYVIHRQRTHEPVNSLWILPPEFDDGLVLYLSFDRVEENGGRTKIIDESYIGNDGILLGGKFSRGKIGNALRCRAKDKSDGVLVGDHASLDLNAVTIAAWIKTNQIDGQWGRIVDKGWMESYNLCIGGDYNEQTWQRNHSQLECAKVPLTSKTPVVDNQWHLLVGTYDGQSAKIYIDGKLDTEKRSKKPMPMKHNAVDLRIGQLAVPEKPPYDEAFFDGLIDEVRLYNRVLSEEEILTLYRYDPDR